MKKLIFIFVLLFSTVCFSQSTDSRKSPVADDKNYHWGIIGYEIDGDTVFINEVECNSVSYPTVQRFDKEWYTLEIWSYPQQTGYFVDTLYVIKSDMNLILKILELQEQIEFILNHND